MPGWRAPPSAAFSSSCMPIRPAELRDALARALRDPSLTLAYWLPDFESYADLDGGRWNCRGAGRTTTLIERDGAHVAALLHDPALHGRARAPRRRHRGRRNRARERSTARRAQGPPGRAARVARPGHRRGTERAPAAGAQPARRRTATAHRALARAEPAGAAARATIRDATARLAAAQDGDRSVARRAARGRARPAPRRRQRARPGGCARAARSAGGGARAPHVESARGCRSRSRWPPSTSCRRASPTSANTRRRPRRASR